MTGIATLIARFEKAEKTILRLKGRAWAEQRRAVACLAGRPAFLQEATTPPSRDDRSLRLRKAAALNCDAVSSLGMDLISERADAIVAMLARIEAELDRTYGRRTALYEEIVELEVDDPADVIAKARFLIGQLVAAESVEAFTLLAELAHCMGKLERRIGRAGPGGARPYRRVGTGPNGGLAPRRPAASCSGSGQPVPVP